MNGLAEHLQGRPAAAFKPNELNEILLLVYNFLKWAVRDGCDELRFTIHDATWTSAGCPVGHFPQSARQTVSFRSEMERILARDAVVRHHLQVVTATPDEVIYRIAADGAPLAGAVGKAGAAADDRRLTTEH